MKYRSKVAMVIAALLLPATMWAQETPTSPDSSSGDSKTAVTVTEIPVSDPALNLVRNGDFSDGKAGWKGNGSIVELDGIKALEAKMRFSSKQTISTILKVPSDTSVIQVYFGIKLDDAAKPKYSSPVRIYFVQGNLITYYDIRLDAGKKKNTSIIYPVFPGTRDLTMQVEVNEGAGSVFLYNFVGVAKSAK